MSFLKKSWPFVLAGVIVCIGGFVFGLANNPKSPIKIYKTVDPTQMEPVHQTQGSAREGDRQAPQTSNFSQGTVQSTQQEPVRDPSGSDIVTSSSVESDSKTTEGVVAESPDTKGAVPPELSRKAMERLHRETRREQRIREIMEEISTYANRDISNKEFLQVVELQEELVRIQQESGMHYQEKEGISAMFNYFKFAATHMTEDGRFPTGEGQRLIEGIQATAPDSVEKQQAIEQLNQTLKIAIENGDEYFKLGPAGQ